MVRYFDPSGRIATLALVLLALAGVMPVYSQVTEAPPATAFVIPFEVTPEGVVTETRVTIFGIAGRTQVLFLSADCDGCKFESTLSMMGMQSLVWADGAVHVYAGRDTTQTQSSSDGGATRILPDGRMVMVSGGSMVEANRLAEWVIQSDPDSPLVFRLIGGRGYVHAGGRGAVTGPNGSVTELR